MNSVEKGIGQLISHARYGKAKVTHTWHKIINPVDKTRVLDGLTFELLTERGKALFQKDRRLFYLKEPMLPRCYEGNLTKIKII